METGKQKEDLASLHSLEGHVPSDLTTLPLGLLKIPSLPVTPRGRDQTLNTWPLGNVPVLNDVLYAKKYFLHRSLMA